MRLIALAFVLAGCAGREPATEGAVAHPPVVHDAAPRRGAPPVVHAHTGRIVLIAATDRGDAAISFDGSGGLRLWPALDGTHEPVQVIAPEPRQMAIGDGAAGLVVALVDGVGGVDVIAFDRDGGVLERTQLSAEPAAEEVAVVGGHVLVRRRDQSITRHATDGAARGRVTASPKHRLTGLAVRRGAVLVGISTGSGEAANAARFIELGEPLAWGASVTLPVPLVELALAPGGTRVAGFAGDGNAAIVDLAPSPTVIGKFTAMLDGPPRPKHGKPSPPLQPIIGFIDDDHVAVSAPRMQWADRASGWKLRFDHHGQTEAHASIGDRAVFGDGAGLSIADGRRTRSLGYRKLGSGRAGISDGLRLLRGTRETMWLDGRLRATRTLADAQLVERDPTGPGPSAELALDDRRVLVTRSETDAYSGRQFVEIRDLAAQTTKRIGVLDTGHSASSFDRGTGVVAFRADTTVARFRLDVATGTGAQLRSLSGTGDELKPIYLTDPARAGGVCAIVASVYEDRIVSVYRVPSDGDVPGRPIEPARVVVEGAVIAVDRAANVYVVRPTGGIVVHALASPAPSPPAKVAMDDKAYAGVATDDGETLVFLVPGGVAAFERTGRRRWHARVDVASAVGLRGDTVIAEGASGYVALSLATGERVASACGWGFGLYERGELDAAPNVPSTCADGR